VAEPRLNVRALYAALDKTRRSRDLSWRDLAKSAGVSPSTLTRLGQGKRPDVDSFGALVQWLGISAEQFLEDPRSQSQQEEPEPMAVISTYLRASKDLSPKSAEALEDIIEAAYKRLKEADSG